jgi:UDP-GlcNAc:undecaprenyl-phosphate GlcNAc-1-phosphate transferase
VKEYLLTLLVTAAVTYMLTPLVRRVAIKAGAVKQVRDRDVHVIPIPEFGGVAMYAGLAAGLLVAGQIKPLNGVFSGNSTISTETGLLLAGGVIVAIGVIDDRWGMSPISKLAGQVAAGVILVASGCEIGWLPLPGSTAFSPSPNQDILLTILIVVATINAVNFIDGLDGLATGIVAIAAVSFFLYYYSLTKELGLSTEAGPALVSALLIGMCLGFLPHNFYPARIFMGDTGAMLLGLLLAYAPISSTSSLDPQTLISGHAYHLGTVNRFPEILPLLLPTAILVIPYADMLLAVFRRTRAGKSPFAADRKHLHHRLLDIGHSHRSSVIIMYLWAALFSSAVVSLSILGRPSWVFATITVGAVLLLLLMSMPRLRWWGRRERLAAAAAGSAAPAGSVGPASPATGPGRPSAPAGVLVPAAARLSGGSGVPGSNGVPGGNGVPRGNGVPGGNGHRRRSAEPVPMESVPMSAPTPEPPRHRSGLPPDWPGSPGDRPLAERSRTSPDAGADRSATGRDVPAGWQQPGARETGPRSVIGFVPPAIDEDRPPPPPEPPDDPRPPTPRPPSPPRSGAHRRPSP